MAAAAAATVGAASGARAALAALSQQWLRNTWLLWGVGPVIAYVLGFFVTASALELLLATHWLDDRLLVYGGGGGDVAPDDKQPQPQPPRRAEALAATHARIPFAKQLRVCVSVMLGPTALVNGVLLALMMRAVGHGTADSWWPSAPSPWWGAAWQLFLLSLVFDLGLYLGHRAMHEVDALWRVHRVHHLVETPTPFATLYIHRLDAALQGSIPMAAGALLVRPAPAVLYLAFAARVAENALNHSGLAAHPLLDLLSLKFLPGRCAAAHHDAHHKYCYGQRARAAKNLGETWVFWDWAAGTLNTRSGRPQGSSSLVTKAA